VWLSFALGDLGRRRLYEEYLGDLLLRTRAKRGDDLRRPMSEDSAKRFEKPNRWWRSPPARFVIKFLSIAALGFALYCFPYAGNGAAEASFDAYLSAYARLAGAVLSLFEPGVTVAGTVILGRSTLAIAKNCDAMEVLILFGAAIVGVGGPWRRSAVALFAGLAALVGLNLARICSLYFIAVHLPTSFDVIHLEVWPLLLVAFAVGEFLLCAKWVWGNETWAEDAAR
jgi:exosortase/archaeosortase family protein